METAKKALYNLLRMNWLNDPGIQVEEWQVEDYRAIPAGEIFQRLQEYGVILDEQSFYLAAEEAESPEDLTENLFDAATTIDPMEQDQVYLLIFELWRRLIPERLCLSVFCDELDHQIYLYDKGDLASAEAVQDMIANLQMIMDESADEGLKPAEIFQTVSAASAHDLQSFLYDFIAEQIDSDNLVYASELVEGFTPYLKGNYWFELLEIRILEETDADSAQDQLRRLVQRAVKDDDLSFNLEALSYIAQGGERNEFNKMVRKTVPLVQSEEDVLDLLAICADYFNYRDEDQKELAVQELIDKRQDIPLGRSADSEDEALVHLLKIIR